MSKRDERTYNIYRISTILKNVENSNNTIMDSQILNECYYHHSRISCLQKASRYLILKNFKKYKSRTASIDESLNRKPIYILPKLIENKSYLNSNAVINKDDLISNISY